MAGDNSSTNKGGRDENHEDPPEQDPTRHASDPSRLCAPESLYLDADRFAALWPGIERRLHRRLVRDGLDRDTALDLCQDVATAFLRAPQQVRSREELVETALLAGFRLSQKFRQREAREQIGDLPDVVIPDLADEVERRHILEAAMVAIHALPVRDRLALLGTSSPAALAPRERNLAYVRLHRARRRLRERLRGWLAGVYVGRYVSLRDDFFAEGGLRAVCFSAAALVMVATSILQSGATPPAAAAPARDRAVGAAPDAVSLVAGNGPSRLVTAPPASGLPASPSRDPKGADGKPGPEGSPRSVSVVSPAIGAQANAGLNSRPPGDDSLLCLSGLRVTPDFCVHHPLRRGKSTGPHP